MHNSNSRMLNTKRPVILFRLKWLTLGDAWNRHQYASQLCIIPKSINAYLTDWTSNFVICVSIFKLNIMTMRYTYNNRYNKSTIKTQALLVLLLLLYFIFNICFISNKRKNNQSYSHYFSYILFTILPFFIKNLWL